MSHLPNPFTNSAESVSLPSTEQAAASSAQPPVGAAADLSAADQGGVEESPPADALNLHETGGAFDDIAEIFIGALALDRQFVLDEERFLIDIEEPPLFLRNIA